MGRKSIDNIRKPQILEHFRQVINKEGIHKASVVKIAKNMGVSPNLVLHYFESKEAMVIELFDVIMDQYIEKILKLTHDDIIGMIYELIGKGKIEGEFNDDDTSFTVK